jgi:hypothetical protein
VVGAILQAQAAADAFFTVDTRPAFFNLNRLPVAVHHAGTGNAGLAGVCYHKVGAHARVTRQIKHGKHGPCWFFPVQGFLRIFGEPLFIVIIFQAASQPGYHPMPDNFPVMVNAAADRIAACGGKFPGYVMNPFGQFPLKLQPGDTHQYFPFQPGCIIIDIKH